MERKELRIWKNRASAERSRRNKDLLIENLQHRVNFFESRIHDLRHKNGQLREELMNMMGYSATEDYCHYDPSMESTSTHLLPEPAVF